MRKAAVFVHADLAGYLTEKNKNDYEFTYTNTYLGPPVSLTLPVGKKHYHFDEFPPFFDGLLPEGVMLEALLKHAKIDRNDYFSQLIITGNDLVGAVTVLECQP